MKTLVAFVASVSLLTGLTLAQPDSTSRIVPVNPSDGDIGLPPARMVDCQLGDGELVLSFETPALLQTTTNLVSPDWRNLALSSPFSVPTQQEDGTAVFRAVSAERPALIYVPASYDPAQPIPLLVVLHGFATSGEMMESVWAIRPLADELGFAFCYPDGTSNQHGHRFWNASASCCDFFGVGVDDVAYLQDLVLQVCDQIEIDPQQVYLFGFSNGAFMAHRLAQEHSDTFAAVACLSGTMAEGDVPVPLNAVNVLQVHGTADEIVPYGGGIIDLTTWGLPYVSSTPHIGAQEAVDWWATINQCEDWLTDGSPTLDLFTNLPGPDTVVGRFISCPTGGAVELWSVQNGGHSIRYSTPELPRLIVEWLLAHPKS